MTTVRSEDHPGGVRLLTLDRPPANPASQGPRLGIVDELLPADRFDDTVLRRAARLGAFPRAAYAHTKAALVADALAHVAAETPAEEAAAAAVWTAAESHAARAAQRRKLATR